MKNLAPWIVLCAIAVSMPGCMKTRGAMKGDDSAEESTDDGQVKKSKKVSRLEIEDMKNEITRVSGKLEEIEHAQETNAPADTREKMLALENRVAELEKNQVLVLSEVKEMKDRLGGARQANSAAPSSESAKDLIAEGYSQLEEKNFEGAGDKFDAAIGKGIKGKESADAHFGFGEAKMGSRDFKGAIVEYSKVQEVFSKSPRVPESLYKIGLCFEKLNMKKESRDFFGELIERFPKSTEAKKARAKIK